MCLRFVFLLITRTATWLGLSRREETWRIAEILILRHQLVVLQRRQPGRPGLNWADRALLAILLGVLPKARRQGLRPLVTPDTILRWHRDIVRRRWAARSMRGKTGRPATRRNIKILVLRLARENPEWGYRRIHGELAGLGVKIAASTVWEILKKAGIDPAPRRSALTWSQFLRSQAEAILACDFFTADLLDGTQAHVLAVIEHATRRIRILGVTLHPTGEWTAQQARNLIMDLGEQAHRVKFMIRDRGSNFTTAFDAVLAGAGIRTVLCNVRTPRMNAIAERWIGGCRRELCRFGTFAGLRTVHSSSTDVYPNTPTWTFYGSSYTSRYLTFTAVEQASNVPDASAPLGYVPLQSPTAGQQALLRKYDPERSIPFVDIGNKYVISGRERQPAAAGGQELGSDRLVAARPVQPGGPGRQRNRQLHHRRHLQGNQ